MPTALVGTVILTLRGRGVGQEELVRRVTWLRREILMKGGRVADFAGTPTTVVVARAVTALRGLVGVHKDLLEPVFYAVKRFELSLFRNQVIHLFLQEAIVAAGLYATIKKGQTQRRVAKSTLLKDVTFLSRLLKGEFIFQPGNIEDNMERTLQVLYDHDVLTLEYPGLPGQSKSFEFSCRCRWSPWAELCKIEAGWHS
jgi:glycerol-3-phosphate O-acyltransferase